MLCICSVLKDFAAADVVPYVNKWSGEIKLEEIHFLLFFRETINEGSSVLFRQDKCSKHPVQDREIHRIILVDVLRLTAVMKLMHDWATEDPIESTKRNWHIRVPQNSEHTKNDHKNGKAVCNGNDRWMISERLKQIGIQPHRGP